MPDGERHSRPPLLLVGGFALFLFVTAYLVVSSVTRRSVPTFDPSPRTTTSQPGPRHDDTITVDASDSKIWQYVDFDRGSVVAPPDTAGWDLAVRRYRVIASDAIADLGPKSFEDVQEAPDRGFVANVAAADTVNGAMRRWYRYSMMTHLLEPAGHAYVVRTRDRQYASVQVLGYYCTGLRPGCLTLRYTYPLRPGTGEPRAAMSHQ